MRPLFRLRGLRTRARLLLLAGLLALAPTAAAREAAPVAEDAALEARVLSLSNELRCLVCQNETLAESNAPLAVDLRSEIREQMRAGSSNADVVAFLVARYGEFVLYRPPFRPATALLWLGPLLLLVAGLVLLYRRLLRRNAVEDDGPSDAERARAARLLAGGKGAGSR
jgi:cytochrome c-type biogenesis protein CcmH